MHAMFLGLIAAAALPSIVGPLVTLLFVIAALYILWWGFSKITLPEPFRTLILVVVGLAVLYFLWTALAPMLGAH